MKDPDCLGKGPSVAHATEDPLEIPKFAISPVRSRKVRPLTGRRRRDNRGIQPLESGNSETLSGSKE